MPSGVGLNAPSGRECEGRWASSDADERTHQTGWAPRAPEFGRPPEAGAGPPRAPLAVDIRYSAAGGSLVLGLLARDATTHAPAMTPTRRQRAHRYGVGDDHGAHIARFQSDDSSRGLMNAPNETDGPLKSPRKDTANRTHYLDAPPFLSGVPVESDRRGGIFHGCGWSFATMYFAKNQVLIDHAACLFFP